MGQTVELPPLPPGFTADPPLPPGFTLDSAEPVKRDLPADTKIEARPRPNGILASAEQWLSDLSTDIHKGTGLTLPGRALQKLGAEGADAGQGEGAANYVLSPALGTIQAAKGVTQMGQSGKRLEGAKNALAGTLNAATIPASMFPEAAASKTVGRVADAIPDAARAGRNLNTVLEAAKDVPIKTDKIAPIVARAKELRATGSTMPKVVADTARALETPRPPFAPGMGPAADIPYSMGRDFATNAGRLSAQEKLATNPPMQKQVAELAKAFKNANRDAAYSVGNDIGALYDKGIAEYRQAMKIQSAKDALKGAVTSEAAKWLLATSVAGAIAAKYFGSHQ